MTRSAGSRLRRFAVGLVLGAALLPAGPAAAQVLLPFTGFTPLPAFAWEPVADAGRWTGSYASLSTGYAVTTSRHFGSYSGPTIGFEGGRMWQEGPILYGISGGLDYLAGLDGNLTPGFGRLAYSRDFAGALEVKVGTLLAPDVLLYAKAGAAAVHDTLRVGPTPFSPPLTREDIAILPNARVGVEWAVTDRLSVAVEAGVVRNGLR
ncbi:outer membrane protein [Methylobacterium sp. E-066]|uniref:outer membrane protein n=1 Tax=Methylobacterium sp. E-066 TaxID=2836584 RepID=UPI001FBA3686|nr:outer membrane beta-barrel protein [Methylobacterium sp. E-066]MCJ2138680.1 hypothetical protein [Methylobacterium sp. E-066]